MHTLYTFYNLFVTYTLTKIIKIRVDRTTRLICEGQFGLEWSKTFVVLGINYDVDRIKDGTEINIHHKLQAMKNITKISKVDLYEILNSIDKRNVCLDRSTELKQRTEIQFELDKLENIFIIIHRTNVSMYMRYIQYRMLHYRIASKRE